MRRSLMMRPSDFISHGIDSCLDNPLTTLNKLMDHIWSNDFNVSIFDDLQPKAKAFPKMDVVEKNDSYVVDIAIAGLNKDNLDLEVKDNTLYVKYSDEKSKNEDEDGDIKYLRREISKRSFRRAVVLPDKIDIENIACSYKNGIVTCNIPKLAEHEKSSIKKLKIN